MLKINEGSYGDIFKESIIVKASATLQPYVIPIDSIMEVSILKHINDVDSTISPILYNVSTTKVGNDVKTTLRLSNSGTSLAELTRNMDIEARCEVVERYLPEIIRCVDILHDNGVTHYDLSPDNIIIGDRVNIIDFGLSTIGEVVGESSPYSIPSNIRGVNRDWWILGTHLLMLCLPSTSYDDYMKLVDDAVQWDNTTNPEGAIIDLSDVEIAIPDMIPESLRRHLQPLLSINPSTVYSRRTPNITSPVVLDEINSSISNYFSSLVDGVVSILSSHIQSFSIKPYHITVSISLLCRVFRAHIHSLTPDNKDRMIIGAYLTSLNIWLDDRALRKIFPSTRTIDRLYEYQTFVLNVVDWRVFTLINTSYVTDSTTNLIDVISEDPYRNRYFLLTDEELIDRYLHLLA